MVFAVPMVSFGKRTLVVVLVGLLSGCAGNGGGGIDDGDGGVPDGSSVDGGDDADIEPEWGPTPEFHRFCEEGPWEDTLVPGIAGELAGTYLGDGRGNFTAPGFDPFPDVPDAAMLVFADVDNDGDVDAFAGTYVGVDDDGDGVTKLEGDCDDTNGDVPQIRDVRGGGHSNTQNSRVVHFGLGRQATIDEVTVRWVGGETENITGLHPNARFRVVEGTGTGEAL